MKATYAGHVLAESDDTVVVDGAHYFPLDSVDTSSFSDSEHTSFCGWKGDCKYYHVDVPGAARNENAAWYYPEPYGKAEAVRGRVAFWKGVEVTA